MSTVYEPGHAAASENCEKRKAHRFVRSMCGMQDLLVCQEAAQPVLEAIAKLEKNVDIIEDAIAVLESDSKQLMQRLQIS